jgi:hypothetical protein
MTVLPERSKETADWIRALTRAQVLHILTTLFSPQQQAVSSV